jgi:hypothetical protein
MREEPIIKMRVYPTRRWPRVHNISKFRTRLITGRINQKLTDKEVRRPPDFIVEREQQEKYRRLRREYENQNH